MDPIQSRFSERSRVAWWVFVLSLGGILLYVLFSFLGTFVLGLFAYYITRPVHRRVSKRIRSPTLAAGVSLITVALPALLLLIYTLVVVLDRLGEFIGTETARYASTLQPIVAIANTTSLPDGGSVLENPSQLLDFVDIETVTSVLASASGYVGILIDGMIHLFIVLALVFYLLRDDHRLAAWFRAEFGGTGSVADVYATTVDQNLEIIFFGNILNALAIAVVAALSYTGLNLVAPPGLSIPEVTLLALLTGVASLVPVVGMKIVYVPVVIYQFGMALLTAPATIWFPILVLVVAFVVVDTIPDIVLRPYVSGRNLHVGTVLFAYIIGPLLFGWYGLFLGPLLLVLIVQAARLLLPALIRGEPFDEHIDAEPHPGAAGSMTLDDFVK